MGMLAYALLFGVVSGMMVFISFNELIVTALQYDPDRKYVAPQFSSLCVCVCVCVCACVRVAHHLCIVYQ